jgi:hypothetical protein
VKLAAVLSVRSRLALHAGFVIEFSETICESTAQQV